MTTPVENLLNFVDRYEERSNGVWAICPAHKDSDPSLHVEEGEDGRAVFVCRAGCSQKEVLDALEARGLKRRDLFAGASPNGRHAGIRVIQGGKSGPVNTEGCTLEAYAASKELPAEWLASIGLSDRKYQKKPAVRIPYFGEDGQEVGARFRIALEKGADGTDDRFRWRSGDKAMPYGLWKLEKIRQAGEVVLVEGESDTQTLWYQGFPALGVPGASNWKREWSEHLEGVEKVYAVIEPDEGGRRFLDGLVASGASLGDRLYIVELGAHKDPSDLYLHDKESFKESFRDALEAAKPYSEVEREEREAAAWEAWAECGELAQEQDILSLFAEDLHKAGVAGETRVAKILYLVITTRYLEKPTSVAVKGPSSGGKSYLTEKVLSFHPEGAHYSLTAMSEKALAYSEEPISHRFLVIYEATGMEGEMQAYLIRSLLSEGRIRYELAEATPEGVRARLVEREGPTGLIVTTTQTRLHPENETRILSLTVNDTQRQTRDVMRALASKYRQKRTHNSGPNMRRWHALQEWVDQVGSKEVDIPYAEVLSEMIPPMAVRLRRDFHIVLNLIEAHAILHQATREKDADGQIIATIEDYRQVWELVASLLAEGLDATVPPVVRETVVKLKALYDDLENKSDGISAGALREELKLDKNATARRLRLSIEKGYVKNLEDRKGKPGRYVPGDPLPEDVAVLPTPEELVEKYRTTVPSDSSLQDIPPQTFFSSSDRTTVPTDSTEKEGDEDISTSNRTTVPTDSSLEDTPENISGPDRTTVPSDFPVEGGSSEKTSASEDEETEEEKKLGGIPSEQESLGTVVHPEDEEWFE